MAPPLPVISYNSAELMPPNEVPELGDFYHGATGKRMAFCKLAESDRLNTDELVAGKTTISSVRTYETTNNTFDSMTNGLEINAEAELHLMEGKLNLSAKFDWTKRDESEDDSVSITKGMRILTHRRTLNNCNFTDEEQQTMQSVQSQFKATHIASELVYGHFVTMTITFKKSHSLLDSDMTAGGAGDISMASFSGSLSGQVNVVEQEEKTHREFNISFTCSNPAMMPFLSADLEPKELYAEATSTFNDIAATLSDQAEEDLIDPNSGGVALGFTYTPIDFLLKGQAGSGMDKKDQERAMNVYKNVKQLIIRLRELQRRTDTQPRMQAECGYKIQLCRDVRSQFQGLLIKASATLMSGGGYVKYTEMVNPDSPLMKSYTALTTIFPDIGARFLASQRRVAELAASNVAYVRNVDDMFLISNTTQRAPSVAAVVPMWDGTPMSDGKPGQQVPLYEMKQVPPGEGGSEKSVRYSARWEQAARVEAWSVSEACAHVNATVAAANEHQRSHCAVLDTLSFTGANIGKAAIIKPEEAPNPDEEESTHDEEAANPDEEESTHDEEAANPDEEEEPKAHPLWTEQLSTEWLSRGNVSAKQGEQLFREAVSGYYLGSLKLAQGPQLPVRPVLQAFDGKLLATKDVALDGVWTHHAINAVTAIRCFNGLGDDPAESDRCSAEETVHGTVIKDRSKVSTVSGKVAKVGSATSPSQWWFDPKKPKPEEFVKTQTNLLQKSMSAVKITYLDAKTFAKQLNLPTHDQCTKLYDSDFSVSKELTDLAMIYRYPLLDVALEQMKEIFKETVASTDAPPFPAAVAYTAPAFTPDEKDNAMKPPELNALLTAVCGELSFQYGLFDWLMYHLRRRYVRLSYLAVLASHPLQNVELSNAAEELVVAWTSVTAATATFVKLDGTSIANNETLKKALAQWTTSTTGTLNALQKLSASVDDAWENFTQRVDLAIVDSANVSHADIGSHLAKMEMLLNVEKTTAEGAHAAAVEALAKKKKDSATPPTKDQQKEIHDLQLKVDHAKDLVDTTTDSLAQLTARKKKITEIRKTNNASRKNLVQFPADAVGAQDERRFIVVDKVAASKEAVTEVMLWRGMTAPADFKAISLIPYKNPQPPTFLCYKTDVVPEAAALTTQQYNKLATIPILTASPFIETGAYRIFPVKNPDQCVAVTSPDPKKKGSAVGLAAARSHDRSQQWIVTRVGYDVYNIKTAAVVGAAFVWNLEGKGPVDMNKYAATPEQKFQLRWTREETTGDVFTFHTTPSEDALGYYFRSAGATTEGAKSLYLPITVKDNKLQAADGPTAEGEQFRFVMC